MPTKKKKYIYNFRTVCNFVSYTEPTDVARLNDEARRILDNQTADTAVHLREVRLDDVRDTYSVAHRLKDTVLPLAGSEKNTETVWEILDNPNKIAKLRDALKATQKPFGKDTGFSDEEITAICKTVANS